MTHQFCPGYDRAPFAALVADYPGTEVFEPKDFRTEWGPIFHRGRLDGSARVLVLGQDPAAHESITRRILVGAAGQRVQGLLARLGVTTSYVMVNTFLFSVYGQSAGNRHIHDVAIADYRNRWLDALLTPPTATAVITLGSLARTAYHDWATSRPARAAGLHLAAIKHPTFPESASAAGGVTLAAATKDLLDNWNAALPALRAHVQADDPVPELRYADDWQGGDLAPIPEADLPPGSPGWWTSLDPWAARTGPTADLKRATLTVTVPENARPWH
jgi:uracil-DNA glycosylase